MNTSQPGLWTMTKGEFEESVRQFETAISKQGGSPIQLFDRIRKDETFARRVASFMIRGGIEGSIHQKLVRAIMPTRPANNFWGVEEWSAFHGVNFSREQLQKIAEFPWSEDVLNTSCPFWKGKSIRETHFAFLGLDKIEGKPQTILEWREILSRPSKPRFYPHPYSSSQYEYRYEKFSKEATCNFRWYLMPLDIIPDSNNKEFQDQIKMLPPDYEVPSAVEEITKHILYCTKNRVYLEPNVYGRCRDTISRRPNTIYHAAIGYSVTGTHEGINVILTGADPSLSEGLAASRKIPAQIAE